MAERKSVTEYWAEYGKLTEAGGVVVGVAMMVFGAIAIPIAPVAVLAGGIVAGGSAAAYATDEWIERWAKRRRKSKTVYQRQPSAA